MKPSADYTALILKNPTLITINQIAKDYEMSAQRMNKLLKVNNLRGWSLSYYISKRFVTKKWLDINNKIGGINHEKYNETKFR